jgi:putative ABC transport system substrate-binding protein
VKRRDFIALLGGAAAWPLTARAQQAGKLPTVGFLGAASASVWSQWVAAFVQRLRELGWIEGRNLTIEYRWGAKRVVHHRNGRTNPNSTSSSYPYVFLASRASEIP